MRAHVGESAFLWLRPCQWQQFMLDRPAPNAVRLSIRRAVLQFVVRVVMAPNFRFLLKRVVESFDFRIAFGEGGLV